MTVKNIWHNYTFIWQNILHFGDMTVENLLHLSQVPWSAVPVFLIPTWRPRGRNPSILLPEMKINYVHIILLYRLGPVSQGWASDPRKVKNNRSINHRYLHQPLIATGHFANTLHHTLTALAPPAVHSYRSFATTSQMTFFYAFLLPANPFFTKMSGGIISK